MKARYLLKFLVLIVAGARAQQTEISPQIRTSALADHQISTVDVSPHFITAIRMPEPVNSVVVGDAALFQVEHSDHEPELVFVKALTVKSAQSNLLISTIKGRQASFLLVSRGDNSASGKVDFLFRSQVGRGFLIEPSALPFALVSQTTALEKLNAANQGDKAAESSSQPNPLDELLERQRRAPLPRLSGQGREGDEVKGDRLRAGISEVNDDGQQVVVLFSVVDSGKRPILLMPPQVQLGGKEKSAGLARHGRWTTAEQLVITDFRLSPRRLGPGERSDGVVQFERPPYKQSNETLFLQMAESGAVDKPALVPIGFGIGSAKETPSHER